jgi:hypothetical protein
MAAAAALPRDIAAFMDRVVVRVCSALAAACGDAVGDDSGALLRALTRLLRAGGGGSALFARASLEDFCGAEDCVLAVSTKAVAKAVQWSGSPNAKHGRGEGSSPCLPTAAEELACLLRPALAYPGAPEVFVAQGRVVVGYRGALLEACRARVMGGASSLYARCELLRGLPCFEADIAGWRHGISVAREARLDAVVRTTRVQDPLEGHLGRHVHSCVRVRAFLVLCPTAVSPTTLCFFFPPYLPAVCK